MTVKLKMTEERHCHPGLAEINAPVESQEVMLLGSGHYLRQGEGQCNFETNQEFCIEGVANNFL